MIGNFIGQKIKKYALHSNCVVCSNLDPVIKAYIFVENEFVADVIEDTIQNEKQIKQMLQSYKLYEFNDLCIMPGIIDCNMSLHAGYQDQDWQDIESITQLASAGGCTTVINNPLLTNDAWVEDEQEGVRQKIEILSKHSCTDFAQLALLTDKTSKQVSALRSQGAIGFRTYLSPYFQSSIPFSDNPDQLAEIIQTLHMYLPEDNTLVFIHPIVLQGDKDLGVTSPLRRERFIQRIQMNDEELNVADADGLKGEVKNDEDELKEEEVKHETEQNASFLKQYQQLAKEKTTEAVYNLISRREQIHYGETDFKDFQTSTKIDSVNSLFSVTSKDNDLEGGGDSEKQKKQSSSSSSGSSSSNSSSSSASEDNKGGEDQLNQQQEKSKKSEKQQNSSSSSSPSSSEEKKKKVGGLGDKPSNHDHDHDHGHGHGHGHCDKDKDNKDNKKIKKEKNKENNNKHQGSPKKKKSKFLQESEKQQLAIIAESNYKIEKTESNKGGEGGGGNNNKVTNSPKKKKKKEKQLQQFEKLALFEKQYDDDKEKTKARKQSDEVKIDSSNWPQPLQKSTSNPKNSPRFPAPHKTQLTISSPLRSKFGGGSDLPSKNTLQLDKNFIEDQGLPPEQSETTVTTTQTLKKTSSKEKESAGGSGNTNSSGNKGRHTQERQVEILKTRLDQRNAIEEMPQQMELHSSSLERNKIRFMSNDNTNNEEENDEDYFRYRRHRVGEKKDIKKSKFQNSGNWQNEQQQQQEEEAQQQQNQNEQQNKPEEDSSSNQFSDEYLKKFDDLLNVSKIKKTSSVTMSQEEKQAFVNELMKEETKEDEENCSKKQQQQLPPIQQLQEQQIQQQQPQQLLMQQQQSEEKQAQKQQSPSSSKQKRMDLQLISPKDLKNQAEKISYSSDDKYQNKKQVKLTINDIKGNFTDTQDSYVDWPSTNACDNKFNKQQNLQNIEIISPNTMKKRLIRQSPNLMSIFARRSYFESSYNEEEEDELPNPDRGSSDGVKKEKTPIEESKSTSENSNQKELQQQKSPSPLKLKQLQQLQQLTQPESTQTQPQPVQQQQQQKQTESQHNETEKTPSPLPGTSVYTSSNHQIAINQRLSIDQQSDYQAQSFANNDYQKKLSICSDKEIQSNAVKVGMASGSGNSGGSGSDKDNHQTSQLRKIYSQEPTQQTPLDSQERSPYRGRKMNRVQQLNLTVMGMQNEFDRVKNNEGLQNNDYIIDGSHQQFVLNSNNFSQMMALTQNLGMKRRSDDSNQFPSIQDSPLLLNDSNNFSPLSPHRLGGLLGLNQKYSDNQSSQHNLQKYTQESNENDTQSHDSNNNNNIIVNQSSSQSQIQQIPENVKQSPNQQPQLKNPPLNMHQSTPLIIGYGGPQSPLAANNRLLRNVKAEEASLANSEDCGNRSRNTSSLFERRMIRRNLTVTNANNNPGSDSDSLQGFQPSQFKISLCEISTNKKEKPKKEEIDMKQDYLSFLAFRPPYWEHFAISLVKQAFFKFNYQFFLVNTDENIAFNNKDEELCQKIYQNMLLQQQQEEEKMQWHNEPFLSTMQQKSAPIISGSLHSDEEQAQKQDELNKKNKKKLVKVSSSSTPASILTAAKQSRPRFVFTNVGNSFTVSKIYKLKQVFRGVDIFTETSFPYLYYDCQMIKDGDTRFKCEPAINDKTNKKLMISSLQVKGTIDVIGSYNFFVPEMYKIFNNKKGDFRRAADGFFSVGVILQVLWTIFYVNIKRIAEKVHNKMKAQGKTKKQVHLAVESEKNQQIQLKLRRVVRLLCAHPAKMLKIDDQKGFIKKGNFADFVIWDPFDKFEFSTNQIVNSSKFKPEHHMFHKKMFYGVVQATFIRGQEVCRNYREKVAFNESFKAKLINNTNYTGYSISETSK